MIFTIVASQLDPNLKDFYFKSDRKITEEIADTQPLL